MRAKFINEKFTEDSDPVKDLGIGLPTIMIEIAKDKEKFMEKYQEIVHEEDDLYFDLVDVRIDTHKRTIIIISEISPSGMDQGIYGTLTIKLDFKNHENTTELIIESEEDFNRVKDKDVDEWKFNFTKIPTTFEELFEELVGPETSYAHHRVEEFAFYTEKREEDDEDDEDEDDD